ncbi:hypothetical protein FQN50_000689 [Emmonsiellopsis sp. PD_5]|nr:hypothetical protein FQN50_000689 [Emmonsiellopsis sp. PD_5]
MLSEIYWLVVSVIWGFVRLFETRSFGPKEENTWTFGQILPLLLLASPLIALFEHGLELYYSGEASAVAPGSISSSAPGWDHGTDIFQASTSVSRRPSWSRDLELMHHYTSEVFKTLSERREVQDVWRVTFPQTAYSCEFLMHGILALSALHLSFINTQSINDYIDYSTHHLHCALGTYRRTLANIRPENCIAAFAFSSLLVPLSFGLPLVDGSGPSISKLAALFSMCRGVPSILMPYRSLICSTHMNVLFRNEYLLMGQFPSMPRVNLILPECLTNKLSQLKEYVAKYSLEPEDRDVHDEAFKLLEVSFDFVEKTAAPLECGAAFMLPIMVPYKFIGFLQEYHHLSLILLSYYCIVLNCLDNFWFLRRWDQALLMEIQNLLPPDLHGWIEWPKAMCGLQ